MLRPARTLSARRVPLAAGLLVPVLLGCSGESAGPEPAADPVPRAAVEELAARYAGDAGGAGEGADPATATCFAEALAARTTSGELEDAGLIGPGSADAPALPRPLAEEWVAAQAECVDTYAELARAQTAFAKGDLRADEYAACLRAAVPEPDLRAALVDGLTGTWDSPALTTLAGAQARCADQPD